MATETGRYESFTEFIARLKREAERVWQAIANGTLGEEDFSVDSEGNPIDRDSPLAQIYQTIIGRANDIPPEILQDTDKAEAAFQRIFLAEVARIKGEIDNAGGFEQWQNQQQQASEQSAIQRVLDEAREAGEELTEEQEQAFRNIFNTIKGAVTGAIPTNMQDLKDLLNSILKGTVGAGQECEVNTTLPDGTVTGGWGGVSVKPDGTTYSGWKDCVNLGALIPIPGLDIPLPPSMGTITWRDLEDAVREAGQDIKDVLSDPGGWLEDQAEKAKDKVRKVLATIQGGISDKDLEDIIRDAVGGSIGGWITRYIYDSVKQEVEEQFPGIFITDPDIKPEECEDDEFYSEVTEKCEKIKQAPIWNDNGPTAEECASQNRTHIPGNAESQTPSRCGGCAEGFEPVTGGNDEVGCQPVDEVLGPCDNPEQVRNELGVCEDPVTFTPGDPCKTELGEDGTYDENGGCVADPVVIDVVDDFGMCPDGVTPRADKQGSNCTVATNPCENPEYANAPGNEEECASFLTPAPEPEPEPEPQPEPGDKCPEGFSYNVNTDTCEPIRQPPVVTEPGGECANGADDYPLCSECADGTRPSDHEGGVCPGPTTGGPTEPPPVDPPEPPPVDPPEPPGGGGGGGGSTSGMLLPDVPDWARQQFTAVEYRAPTRAIDVLNNFIDTEMKQSLLQNSTKKKGMFGV